MLSERLDILSWKAHDYARSKFKDSNDNPLYDDAFAAKFSELIIDECVNVIERSKKYYKDNDHIVAAATCFALTNEIKEYFGD